MPEKRKLQKDIRKIEYMVCQQSAWNNFGRFTPCEQSGHDKIPKHHAHQYAEENKNFPTTQINHSLGSEIKITWLNATAWFRSAFQDKDISSNYSYYRDESQYVYT